MRCEDSHTRAENEDPLIINFFEGESKWGRQGPNLCQWGTSEERYISKEEAALPTAATDSVFITGAIASHENRDVVTMDLPGAFLTTLTDELIFMVLKGNLCKLMCRVNPKLYRRYVTKNKKGDPVLYVQLYKSLYSLLHSALLFYRKLHGELEAYGFQDKPIQPMRRQQDYQ